MFITEEEYREFESDFMGFCPDCGDFTRSMTEPDADGYDCPVCGGMSVMGTMTALLSGAIGID